MKLRSDGSAARKPTVRPAVPPAPTWIKHPREDLFGLALSGGGIRSATFNLGLLQALARLKLLDVFHYLSTVSGGGYVGSFWTAWRARAGLRADPCADLRPRKKAPCFPDTPSTLGLAEPDPVHHLRQFSNFLRPRPGLLNPDSGRMVSSVVNATIPSLLAALALLTLGVLFWELLAHWSIAGERGLLLLALLTSVKLVAGEVAWRKMEVRGDRGSRTRGDHDSRSLKEVNDLRSLEGSRAYVLAALCAVGITLGLGWYFARGNAEAQTAMSGLLSWRRLQTWLPPSGPMLQALFSPAAVWVATAGALVVGRFLFSRLGRSALQPAWTYAVGRAISRLFLLAALWVGMALCWLGGAWIGEGWFHVQVQSLFALGVPTLAAALMAVLTRLQQRFTRQPSRPSVPGKRERVRPVAIPLLSSVVVVLFLIGVVALVTHARTQGQLLPLFLLAAGITAATLFCFDTTRVGLHHFYRSRLARAYLGASLPESGGAEPASERRADDLPLTALSHADPARPLHLIC
ncbi:patatin-like phospholipase family protein [Corallococcus sp. CA054B]|uniref:patatin-like phospholipase family protein n=1 Tax=Corallococcus sp. CA054B TaxID=2316734 RepID=UPI0018F4C6D9|nr:patatin-like phospholipase family protein [Corallococcus sp. CA054B]